MTPPSPLVWLDLEMTDLDPRKGVIVEIASLVTDSQLKIIEEGPSLVIHQPQDVLDSLETWSKDHFAQSGLLAEIKTSTISLDQAEAQTLSFIREYCPPQTGILAGCSVHVDRLFLFHHMPKIYGYLHHHILDVDTFKEAAFHWYPSLPEYPKEKSHRARRDILDSIAELKYYRENILKPL